MTKLKRKIGIVWKGTTRPAPDANPERPHARYVARAYDHGIPGWGVFDRSAQRYLSNKEVMRIPDAELSSAMVAN